MHELSPPPAGARRSRRVEGQEVHEDGRLSRRNVVVAGGTGVAAASVTAVLALKPFGKATAAPKSDSMALTAQLKKANAAEAADIASSGAGSATNSGATAAAGASGTAAETEKASGAASTIEASSFSMDRDLSPALLLSRATYGHTTASAAEMKRLGPRKWLEWQLKPGKIADPGVKPLEKFWPQLKRTTAQAAAAKDDFNYQLVLAGDHLGRAISAAVRCSR